MLDFSFDDLSFDVGEGQHVASVFPNPASKNQVANREQEIRVRTIANRMNLRVLLIPVASQTIPTVIAMETCHP